MPDVDNDDDDDDDGNATADDESVQGDDNRDAAVERTFAVRKDYDEGDVTEDEELWIGI